MNGWGDFVQMTLGTALCFCLATVSIPAAGAGGGAPGEADRPFFTPDFYPILTWDPYHGWKGDIESRGNGLASMAQCNINVVGFVLPKDLPECERLGVKAIMAAEVPNPGAWSKEWKKLTDEEIERRVRQMIDTAGDSPAVLGYFLTDEPGAASFPALAKAVAAVRKYAPGKLAYINLFPGYATIGAPDLSQLETGSFTEYLERYVAEVKPQFISYDNYQVQYSQDMKDKERAASYYGDLLEVRRVAMKNGIPFWNIVSSNQIRPFSTIPSPANLRFQAYTTLAAGGRGLTWYTYYAGNYGYAPIGADGDKTLTWDYLQSVNHEVATLGPLMNQMTSTGVYFTAPAPVDGLPPLPGKKVDAVESEAPLMVGEFAGDDGTPYVMLVNLSLERSAKVTPMKGGKALGGVFYSAQDGRPRPIDGKFGLWLTAGQGVLLRLEEPK
ncbi:MAG: hypothetical protein M1457_01355 [bacterium]|nr:hypothetical protein [bacterium]